MIDENGITTDIHRAGEDYATGRGRVDAEQCPAAKIHPVMEAFCQAAVIRSENAILRGDIVH